MPDYDVSKRVEKLAKRHPENEKIRDWDKAIKEAEKPKTKKVEK